VDFVDLNTIFIALATMQANATSVMNATSIMGPAANTLNQFFAQVIAAIPKVISAAIILLIGWIVGRGVGWLILKILNKMNFEDALGKTGLGKAVSRSGWSMSRIIATAAKWFIYIFFITAAVNALQFTQLADALQSIWLWIPNVIAFIVILIIGSIVAEFVGNWAQKELPARGVPGGSAIGLGTKGIIYAITFVVAITQLQIGAGILNMVISALVWGIAGAIAIGLGVGLAFGLKDILPSLIHGTTNVQTTLKPGQKIRVDGHVGTIKQAGSLHIIMQNDKGETVILPTKMIADKEIIIESGPEPELPEKKAERMVKELDDESKGSKSIGMENSKTSEEKNEPKRKRFSNL
jgi:hypothetical protein